MKLWLSWWPWRDGELCSDSGYVLEGQLSVLADINELLVNLKQKRNVDISKNLRSKRTNKDTGRIVGYVNQGI